MELWILRIDMYNEWAAENGACTLLGIYDKRYKAIRELEKNLNIEKEQGFIIEDNESITEIINNINDDDKSTKNFVDVYSSKYNYNSGNSCSTYVLEKKILNTSTFK